MKYWSYLVAKLAVAGGLVYLIGRVIRLYFPPPEPFLRQFAPDLGSTFAHDLGHTFIMLGYTLLVAGVLYAIIWDQRYRCRSCLRRLRMPIQKGSWTHILFGRPRTEYICPYGHGTLQVDELQITGRHEPDWQPHDDMWKELYSLEESKK